MTPTRTRPVTSAGPRPAKSRPARQPLPPLAIKARLRNGELFTGRLPATGHRRVHLGLLHCATDGYVELAAGPRPSGGKVRFITRKDSGHFLPGGATASVGWLEDLLELAARHDRRGDELAVAPAVRDARGAAKRLVTHTNWLWIDVDGADDLPEVKRFLRRKPAHLVVESAGSGGVHCYWRLREPLQAHPETMCAGGARGSGPPIAGMTGDPIERAHERLIYALGYTWSNGTPIPTIADRACKDRSRVMRLAGTYQTATPDTIFRHFIEGPGELQFTPEGVNVALRARAHTPVLLDAGLPGPHRQDPLMGRTPAQLQLPARPTRRPESRVE